MQYEKWALVHLKLRKSVVHRAVMVARSFNVRRPRVPAMLRRMQTKPSIILVGPGRLGSVLAVALRAAGFGIAEIVGRPGAESQRRARKLAARVGARAATAGTAALDADIVWICVPDAEIEHAATSLAPRFDGRGRAVFHASGALTSDELSALRRRGAACASVHPLMSFVGSSKPSLRGVPFALEGDTSAVREARRVVKALGGEAFSIARNRKVAYHTWGAFASPLLISALATAETVAVAAGLTRKEARRRMLPIVKQTVLNYAAHGAAASFSGPIVRGDVETVKKHLGALSMLPQAKEVYLALARAALTNLPGKNAEAMRRTLVGGAGKKGDRGSKRKK